MEVSQSFLHSASWVNSYENPFICYHGLEGQLGGNANAMRLCDIWRTDGSQLSARTDNFWSRGRLFMPARFRVPEISLLPQWLVGPVGDTLFDAQPTPSLLTWEEDKVLWVEDANEFRFESEGKDDVYSAV